MKLPPHSHHQSREKTGLEKGSPSLLASKDPPVLFLHFCLSFLCFCSGKGPAWLNLAAELFWLWLPL